MVCHVPYMAMAWPIACPWPSSAWGQARGASMMGIPLLENNKVSWFQRIMGIPRRYTPIFLKQNLKATIPKMRQNNSTEVSGSSFLNMSNTKNLKWGQHMKSRLLVIQEAPRNKKCRLAIWVFTHLPWHCDTISSQWLKDQILLSRDQTTNIIC